MAAILWGTLMEIMEVRMRANKAKQRMLEGKPAIGCILTLDSPVSAEILSRTGLDFILVDTQHGSWETSGIMSAFRSISLGSAVPMARVQQNDYYAIGTLLDKGALGIVVPMVNSAKEAEAAAYATRYPPKGGRSAGAHLAGFHGADYADWIDDQVFLAVQIETAGALDCVEEIMAVDGVDGCFVGPVDLGLTMGIDPGTDAGRQALEGAILRVLDACRKTNKLPGLWGGDRPQYWVEQGFLFVAAASDLGLLRGGAEELLGRLGRLT
jgi:2-keto-3-deoxy-L-rhamnonate aldolase RhmA